jgi:hypothetical protein
MRPIWRRRRQATAPPKTAIVPRVRIPLAPPVSPVGTFFSLRSAPGGTPQDAGLSAKLSEPRGPASGPTSARFPSLSGPSSLTQPNHGHFGTVVESSIIQCVAWHPKGVGFAKAPLRRSEPGSNPLVQCVCFRPQSGPVIGRLRPAAAIDGVAKSESVACQTASW